MPTLSSGEFIDLDLAREVRETDAITECVVTYVLGVRRKFHVEPAEVSELLTARDSDSASVRRIQAACGRLSIAAGKVACSKSRAALEEFMAALKDTNAVIVAECD